jgi:hypothetical protein
VAIFFKRNPKGTAYRLPTANLPTANLPTAHRLLPGGHKGHPYCHPALAALVRDALRATAYCPPPTARRSQGPPLLPTAYCQAATRATPTAHCLLPGGHKGHPYCHPALAALVRDALRATAYCPPPTARRPQGPPLLPTAHCQAATRATPTAHRLLPGGHKVPPLLPTAHCQAATRATPTAIPLSLRSSGTPFGAKAALEGHKGRPYCRGTAVQIPHTDSTLHSLLPHSSLPPPQARKNNIPRPLSIISLASWLTK